MKKNRKAIQLQHTAILVPAVSESYKPSHFKPRSMGKLYERRKIASREHYVRRNTPSGRTPLTIIRYVQLY